MDAAYFSSLGEVAVSVGILGYGLMAFTLGVRYLPLFPEADAESMADERVKPLSQSEPLAPVPGGD